MSRDGYLVETPASQPGNNRVSDALPHGSDLCTFH